MSQEKHIPTSAILADVPDVGVEDIYRYYPFLLEVAHAFKTGTGTFSTNSPIGKLYVRVQRTPFQD